MHQRATEEKFEEKFIETQNANLRPVCELQY
jgi:hypothetical protein